MCKPYLNLRSQVAPYVQPYYDFYAARHVDKARPYVNKFNKQVYAPILEYGRYGYDAYGAPKVEQARAFGQEKWEKTVKPRFDTAQAQVKKQYDSNLAPQVNKVSAAAAPYYTSSRNNAFQIYSTHLLPALEASRPYVQRTYATGHKLAVQTGIPYAQSAWASTVVFFDRTLWPKLRILYGENVEPQLVRIGERLGRYRDGKRLKAAMEDENSSSQSSSTSSNSSSIVTSVLPSQASSLTTTTGSSTTSSSPTVTPEEEVQQARENIESELRTWQDKFAKAADKGTEDLEERVKEITDRQIKSQVRGVGEALLVQLKETSSSELQNFKKGIIALVKQLPVEHDDTDLGKALLALSRSTRNAGLAVKNKAQALRMWREKYDRETQSLVSAASESTLEVIDSIRDLGLQEIGLRWAQMEGVTYKNWSKYHEVKKTFDEWRRKIEAVAQDHEGLTRSKDASEDLELRAMASAEETAKELARLKEVGQWKIEAGDQSDDFSTKYMSAQVTAAAQKVMEKASVVSEQVVGTSQGIINSVVSQATEQAFKTASRASSVGIGTEPGIVERASSSVAGGASVASEEASRAVTGTSLPAPEDVVSAAKDKVNGIASDASEAVVAAPASAPESLTSRASEGFQSVASAISEGTSGSATPLAEDVSSSASAMARETSKKVYGGAMAQKVAGQKPILDDVFSDDDDATYSEKMQSMANQAGDKYAEITKAVSEALMKATSTQGTLESASSVADEQYSKALAAASSALYGTETGVVESASSAAAGKYSQAVSA